MFPELCILMTHFCFNYRNGNLVFGDTSNIGVTMTTSVTTWLKSQDMVNGETSRQPTVHEMKDVQNNNFNQEMITSQVNNLNQEMMTLEVNNINQEMMTSQVNNLNQEMMTSQVNNLNQKIMTSQVNNINQVNQEMMTSQVNNLNQEMMTSQVNNLNQEMMTSQVKNINQETMTSQVKNINQVNQEMMASQVSNMAKKEVNSQTTKSNQDLKQKSVLNMLLNQTLSQDSSTSEPTNEPKLVDIPRTMLSRLTLSNTTIATIIDKNNANSDLSNEATRTKLLRIRWSEATDSRQNASIYRQNMIKPLYISNFSKIIVNNKDFLCQTTHSVSCQGICDKFRNPSCSCDDLCQIFRDCCYDYHMVCKDDWSRGRVQYAQYLGVAIECLPYVGASLVIAGCPPDTSVQETEDCSSGKDAPVTYKNDFRLVFKNIFCYRCFKLNESQGIIWELNVYIPGNKRKTQFNLNDVEGIFRAQEFEWIVSSKKYSRLCLKTFNKECLEDANFELKNLCHTLSTTTSVALVDSNNIKNYYVNAFCAACNLRNNSDQICQYLITTDFKFSFNLPFRFLITKIDSEQILINSRSPTSWKLMVCWTIPGEQLLVENCTVKQCKGDLIPLGKACMVEKKYCFQIHNTFKIKGKWNLTRKKNLEEKSKFWANLLLNTFLSRFTFYNNLWFWIDDDLIQMVNIYSVTTNIQPNDDLLYNYKHYIDLTLQEDLKGLDHVDYCLIFMDQPCSPTKFKCRNASRSESRSTSNVSKSRYTPSGIHEVPNYLLAVSFVCISYFM